MTILLGPPPKELLERRKDTTLSFPAEGLSPSPFHLDLTVHGIYLQSKQADVLPDLSQYFDASTFDWSLPTMTGEDKRLFIAFVKRMLRWMPEDRATARELLEDPWLKD